MLFVCVLTKKKTKTKKAPRPGIEPGFPAWQAGILTTILPRNFLHVMTPWRNGNASDSRPEDWGFDSLWGHFFFFSFLCYHQSKSAYSSVGRAGDCSCSQLISLGRWFDSGCADKFFFFFFFFFSLFGKKKNLRGPGIEPGSTAWKAAMLTITPATPSWWERRGGGKKKNMFEPRIELGTSRVWGARDNQLHHPNISWLQLLWPNG